ncbi:DNA polymerase III subunit alpha [Mangrovibacillus cuniculi]|uniref:DNA polymerase III subunit alpha n=1 Tax=Mangrovibacillus cuniculi TaxID=2593652 RepID=A0A7S8HFV2_9BACI|nr:DNA polymerase III subunit alpha [Mangrovibacillus cuniculi]QPC47213.1 DNA polymerase III subunit alpha [Mangrovibacillus cuniculi]
MAFKGTVLDLQTSYSLLSSTITIPTLIDHYKHHGIKAAAIADEGVLSGVIPFYKACKEATIKPLIGMRATVQWTEEFSASTLLFAENNRGYENLLKISSALQTISSKGLPLNWLTAYKEGLLLVDPTNNGLMINHLNQHVERAIVEKIANEFSFFVGVPPKNDEEKDNSIRTSILTLAKELNITTIPTPIVRYTNEEEKLAHSVLSCIRDNEKLSDRHAWHQIPDQHMWTEQDWEQGYYDIPELLENLLDFIEKCEVEIDLTKTYLPKYPIDNDLTPSNLLRNLCRDRLSSINLADKKQYEERLNYEVEIIEEMGFVDYFLIVWDFMKFARESSIITGPGRGSAAGSLVAYLLQITKVDPLKYGLLFERFLNPDRVSLPDIDIDFPDHRRDDVIEYVANKYGKKHVAQIVTFGTLAAKAAIRDTGRTFGLSTKELEQWSRLIPSKPGTTLEDVYQQSKELRSFIQETDQNQQMWHVAKTIEGLPRHASTHAAGIIISPFPLVEKVPLLHGGEDIPLTQFTMDILESIGLLKMDFLGLRNLSLLERMQSLIRQTTNTTINWDELPLEDERTYKLLQRGDTTGVFQLESEGMRKALQLIKPTEFSDIVAVNALYRPGPMAQIPLYQKRKEKIENYQENEPVLKEVLQETYGIIVYQEQIMQIAHKVACFTLGEADLLRRAVSKKSVQVLQQQRQKFVQGSVNNGYSQERAIQLYDLIVRFAQYGFNKSHAVAYSMISYQLAYAKAHFPLEFLSVLLTTSIGNQDRLAMLLMEAKESDVTILPLLSTKVIFLS